jgi:hypothetical protein
MSSHLKKYASVLRALSKVGNVEKELGKPKFSRNRWKPENVHWYSEGQQTSTHLIPTLETLLCSCTGNSGASSGKAGRRLRESKLGLNREIHSGQVNKPVGGSGGGTNAGTVAGRQERSTLRDTDSEDNPSIEH